MKKNVVSNRLHSPSRVVIVVVVVVVVVVVSTLHFIIRTQKSTTTKSSSSCIPQTKKSRVVVMSTFCLFVEHKKEGKRFQKTAKRKREDISSFLFAQHARLFTLQF